MRINVLGTSGSGKFCYGRRDNMNVKKVLNIASWVIFAFGAMWIIFGSGTLILPLGMILVAIFLNIKSRRLPQEQDNNGKG
jgi:hypothetical protein